ncbi:MAG: two-component sensor histidine kinase [candidate division Zixibacteria bacterium]|nr:two-component sensor histidine kinase [candidate division Zixibacteria bacterium]
MEADPEQIKTAETPSPEKPAGVRLPQYRALRRYLILTTLTVSLAPLIIMATINYVQDTEKYKTESRFTVSRILSNTRRALRFAVTERRSALNLVGEENSYNDLASDANVAGALRSLKNSFGGFVDLGVIDSKGTQLYYDGPYDLKGRQYSDQEWYQQVLLHDVCVSKIFLGYRNVPHFIIAFKRARSASDFYVLRATLDLDMINRQVYSLELDPATDAFLIDDAGLLQTSSAFYGPPGQQVPDLYIAPHSRERELIDERILDDQPVTLGYAYITDSPFILVVIHRRETSLAYWLGHRSEMLWFLLISAALIVLVVTYGAIHVTNQLRQADLKRAKLFHNIEYTSKMATLGRLAASVAHEINNPLAIINEKAGLMKDMATFSDEFPNRDKALALVDSITASVERCSRVTHRLLGFGRRMDIRKEKIVIESLLKEVVGFQATEAAHRNVQIEFHVQDDVATIESDRGQLQQVFLNIVNNGISAVGDGGRIDISVEQPNSNEVTVTIADNGPGISDENLQHVFEPFFSTKGEAGTGLGLSITRDIVEKLGGVIGVSSSLGHGTRFTINLPIEKAD